MGARPFLQVLSASCLARADPHPTARALGSSHAVAAAERIVFGRTLSGSARLRIHFLCNAGIDLGKIRVLARQTSSSNAIFRYTDGAHAQTTVNIASEAAMASSTSSLRCELHLLRAAFAAAPPSASAVLSTSVVPAAGSSPSGVPLLYVRATRAHAPIHVKCPVQTGRAKCGWSGVRVHTLHRTPPAYPFP